MDIKTGVEAVHYSELIDQSKKAKKLHYRFELTVNLLLTTIIAELKIDKI